MADIEADLRTMADNCIKAVMAVNDIEDQHDLVRVLADFSRKHRDKCLRLIAENKARLN